MQLDKGIMPIKLMIDYKKGTMTFDSEDSKAQIQHKVEELETENSIYDLEELKKTIATRSLGILRTIGTTWRYRP